MSDWPPKPTFTEAIGGAVFILGGTAVLLVSALWPLGVVAVTGSAWFLILLIPSLVLTAAFMLWAEDRW